METTKQTDYLQVTLWKALSILAGSVLVAIVGTAFTVGGVLNVDHFTVLANAKEIISLQDDKVDQDVYDVQQEAIIQQLKTLNTTLGEVLTETRELICNTTA